MFTVLLIVQVVLGLSIIGLVLLQQGKGADMGAAFGSGASGTVFGARGGASFFTRATAALAALFFVNSVLLSSPLILKPHDPIASVTSTVTTDGATEEVETETEETLDLPPGDLPDVDVLLDGAKKTAPATDDVPELPDSESSPAADTPAAAEKSE